MAYAAWNWYGVPAAAVGLVAWAMAAFIFLAAPHRAQNRLLALLMVLEGATWGTGGGLLYMMLDRGAAFGMQGIFITAALALPYVSLFLVSTLDSPLAALLRTWTARGLLVAGLVAAEGYWLLNPEAFTVEMVEVWYAPNEAILGPGVLTILLPQLGIGGLVALFVTVSAWRHAPAGTASRRKGAAFALAFGVRDGSLVFFGLVAPLFIPPPPNGTWTDMIYIWGQAVLTLAYLVLVGYGILKTQLFDIDLRIKVGISRGTLAALFLGAFVVAAQVAQEFLSDSLGLAVGAAAAALLLFAAAPLQRVAERVADRAMPGVTASPEYLAFRKLHVYRAAVEAALQDGVVTDRERTVLDRLRHELGIRDEDARAIELDAGRPLPA